MIKHVVTWKFRPGTEKQAEEFLAELNALVGQIEVLRSAETGVNINEKADQSAVLIATFDNLADLETYKNDPRHLAAAAICKEIRLERHVVDFEF